MSNFVFRPQSSTGARELADAIGGRRLRRFENGRFFSSNTRPNPIAVRAGDLLVMWGAHLPGVPAGIKTLNNIQIASKFADAEKLRAAGVNTIEVTARRPQAQAAPVVDPALAIRTSLADLMEDFIEAPLARNDIYRRGVTDILTKVQEFQRVLGVALPAPVAPQAAGDWVGRMNNHVGGADLLNPPAAPDFFVKKIQLVEEYRIHSFCGKSIRAGIKKHRQGINFQPNPWIRSYEGGWMIDYTEFKSKEAMRTLARKAVAALGLQFGAVDIGKLANGTLVVLEVNRAPGLEGGTVDAYAGAITKWMEGNWEAAPAQPRRRAA